MHWVYVMMHFMTPIAPFVCSLSAKGATLLGLVDSRKPVHALVDAFAVNHRAGNDTPISISQFPQFQCFGDLPGTLCSRLPVLSQSQGRKSAEGTYLILFIGKD